MARSFSTTMKARSTLKGYWRLSEDPGDAVAFDEAGPFFGTPHSVTFGAAGSITDDENGAATFDGASSFINLNNSAPIYNSNRNFTIQARVYITDRAADYAVFGTGSGGWLLRIATGTGKLQWIRSQAELILTGGTAVPLNQWATVGATVSAGGLCTLYLNGAPDGSVTTANSLVGGEADIGSEFGTISAFKGKIDEVMFDNVALSGATMAAIHAEAIATGTNDPNAREIGIRVSDSGHANALRIKSGPCVIAFIGNSIATGIAPQLIKTWAVRRNTGVIWQLGEGTGVVSSHADTMGFTTTEIPTGDPIATGGNLTYAPNGVSQTVTNGTTVTATADAGNVLMYFRPSQDNSVSDWAVQRKYVWREDPFKGLTRARLIFWRHANMPANLEFASYSAVSGTFIAGQAIAIPTTGGNDWAYVELDLPTTLDRRGLYTVVRVKAGAQTNGKSFQVGGVRWYNPNDGGTEYMRVARAGITAAGWASDSFCTPAQFASFLTACGVTDVCSLLAANERNDGRDVYKTSMQALINKIRTTTAYPITIFSAYQTTTIDMRPFADAERELAAENDDILAIDICSAMGSINNIWAGRTIPWVVGSYYGGDRVSADDGHYYELKVYSLLSTTNPTGGADPTNWTDLTATPFGGTPAVNGSTQPFLYEILADSVHPTTSGARLLATYLWAGIEKAAIATATTSRRAFDMEGGYTS